MGSADPAALPEAYPAHRATDVVLRDGSTLHVRPVRAEDRERLVEFFAGLSDQSLAFRFLSGAANLKQAVEWALDVDYGQRLGLIATLGAEERIVGQVGYVATAPGRAEVAFAIADEFQSRGLGTILLAHIAEAAEENGISAFEAEVTAQNHRMIEVFRESGFPVATTSVPGAIQIELPTSLAEEAVERFSRRGGLAAAAAVRSFLEPRAVAVIGASRQRRSLGGELFHNLLSAGFEGVVYPVNPAAEVVQSVRSYPRVTEVPGEVDLAVIAVPAAAVAGVARDCAAKGVASLVVISAGFAETGAEGAERQRELVEICRESGMRLVGPNCLGVINTVPGVRLNATFAPAMPPSGNVGFLSQSGALGLALIDLARDSGIGLSSFASIGNRADITGNDLLDYWEGEESTEVVLAYIESFSDPRRFARIAPRLGRKKPIVAVKSGRSQAGARATSSHTGALLSASDVTVDALFHQAGVIRTDSLADLLDVTALLANQPLPDGPRVGIITNAGGPGIMCADAAEAAGLEVPELSEELRGSLREFLPPEAALGNPVDMVATATAEHFRRAIGVLAAWEGIDALIVIFVRPLLTAAEDVAAAVRAACAELPRELPLQAVFMSKEDHAAMARGGGIPTHLYPEEAARALGRVVRHVEWRREPAEAPPSFAEARSGEAAAVISEALAGGPGWLGTEAVNRLLGCYGIAVPGWRIAAGPEAAGDAAEQLGGPVALKAVGPELLHKTDVGAVRTGLSGAAEVAAAAAAMDEALQEAGVERQRFLVQEMVETGTELLIGVVGDALFGPIVACGAGGVQAEILKDVSVRIAPLTRSEAREMITSLASFPLLTGYRGAPKADLAALEDLLLRTSAMVDAHHEIAELDLNPVLAGPQGSVAVDARVRIEAVPPPPSWPSTPAAASGAARIAG